MTSLGCSFNWFCIVSVFRRAPGLTLVALFSLVACMPNRTAGLRVGHIVLLYSTHVD